MEVSLILSAYNAGEYIQPTLDALSRQTHTDVEYIVIDDGSTDNTLSVINQWAETEGRATIHSQANTGLTRALIKGCFLAKGKYIARQDAGDVSRSDRLALQASMLDANPDAVLVACDYRNITPEGVVMNYHEISKGMPEINGSLRQAGANIRGPHHSTVMFRRDAYEAVGGYREAFYYAQDLDLWSRLIHKGDFISVPKALCDTRFSTSCITGIHHSEQQVLRKLIRQAALLRLEGRSDENIIGQACKIRPSGIAHKVDSSSAAYFIGSCLAKNGDSRSRRYFKQAISGNVFHLKAWLKYFFSFLSVAR